MSLDAAMKITAKFENVRTQPPSRDISSTVTILHKQLADWNATISQKGYCKKLRQERKDDHELYAKLLPDIGGDAQLANSASGMAVLAQSAFVEGEYQETIRLLLTALAMAERSDRGRNIAFVNSHMALVTAFMGDADNVGGYARAAKDIFTGLLFNSWVNIDTIKYDAYRFLHTTLSDVAASYAQNNFRATEYYARELLGHDFRKYHSGASMDYDQHLVRAMLVESLLQRGRLSQAELVVREEFATRVFPPSLAHDALYISQLARALYGQDRVKDGIGLARLALKFHRFGCTAPGSPSLAQAYRALTLGLSATGDWRGVVETISKAQAALKDRPKEFERLYGNVVEHPLALVQLGQIQAGLARLEIMLQRNVSEFGENSVEAAEISGFIAFAKSASGAHAAAPQIFRKAVPILLAAQAAGDGVTDPVRKTRLRQILNAYLRSLVSATGGNANSLVIEEMLRAATALHEGRLRSVVTAGAARAAANTPAMAELARREQNAGQELEFVQRKLLGLSIRAKSQKNLSLGRKLRVRVNRLRSARQALRAEIDKDFPAYGALLNPKPLGLKDIQNILRKNEALVFVHGGKKQSYIWAIPASGPPMLHVTTLSKKTIKQKVDRLRRALDVSAQTLGDIPAFDVALAHSLYLDLIKPLERRLQGVKTLLAVTPGTLGPLPLGLLLTAPVKFKKGKLLFEEYRGLPWLIRRYAIVRLPALDSLRSINRGRSKIRKSPVQKASAWTFAGFGDPYFSLKIARAAATEKTIQLAKLDTGGVSFKARGIRVSRKATPDTRALASATLSQLPRLPETAGEIKAIAKTLGAKTNGTVFLGRDASETRVKSLDLSDRSVLVFATHGLTPGDLNGLTQPALALSAPAVTGSKSEEGLLTMSEIFALRLNADWVVLSACNTGADDGQGAQAVSGLGRAFFFAGAKALLASNWAVETLSARSLTTDLFRRQAAGSGGGTSKAQALRRAMLAMADGPGQTNSKGKVLYARSHPIFWAAFSLHGNGK